MFTQSDRERYTELFIKAKEGQKDVQEYFRVKHSLKVWTYLELKGLNHVIKEVKRMGEKYVPKDRYIILPVGHFDDQERNHKVNWIEDLDEGFYLFGVTCEGEYHADPYDKASSVWMMYLEGVKFIPLFNTSHWSIQELIERAKRGLPKSKWKGENEDDMETVLKSKSRVQGQDT